METIQIQQFNINEFSTPVRVRRLCDVPMPSYAHEGDAGLDLVAAIERPIWLWPFRIAKLPTGLALELQPSTYGQVIPRSSVASKGLLLASSGVIDSGYRGEVVVPLINLSLLPRRIRPGDRVAQLLVLPVCRAILAEVAELTPSARGTGGFGSTGR